MIPCYLHCECVYFRGVRVPLFSQFPRFWKFSCAKISAFFLIFSLFLAFLPNFMLFFLVFCLWPLTPLIFALTQCVVHGTMQHVGICWARSPPFLDWFVFRTSTTRAWNKDSRTRSNFTENCQKIVPGLILCAQFYLRTKNIVPSSRCKFPPICSCYFKACLQPTAGLNGFRLGCQQDCGFWYQCVSQGFFIILFSAGP